MILYSYCQKEKVVHVLKKWIVSSPDPEKVKSIQSKYALSFLQAHILCSRWGEDEEAIASFLSQPEPAFFDPFLLDDMQTAVKRIEQALAEGERICVFGDYDCDGLTSMAVLISYLQNLGAEIYPYLPDRDNEGYGMNSEAVRAIAAEDVTLIITVDNGISATEEIALAKTLGIDVIVTDHHQPREILPDAVAILNPHLQKDNPEIYADLAGVGVVFKLICALEGDDQEIFSFYGDFFALGTVADLVPLTGENRTIAKFGLPNLWESQNLGLQCLLQEANINPETADEQTVAFFLAPRINAAGRLGQAQIVLELFLTEDEEQAQTLARQICDLNLQRRSLEEQVLKEIALYIHQNPHLLNERVLILCGKSWHQGILGILASKLIDRFGKPCLLLSEENGEIRGSGRSVQGFNLFEIVHRQNKLLLRYGGHPMAVGLTILPENLQDFTDAVQQDAKKLYPKMPDPSVFVDKELNIHQATTEAIAQLSALGPFGMGNPVPEFVFRDCLLQEIIPIGAAKHLKLKFSQDGESFFAVLFRTAPAHFLYKPGDVLDFSCSCKIDVYKEKPQLSMIIHDLRLAKLEQQRFFDGQQQYARYLRGEDFLTDISSPSVPDREILGALFRKIREIFPCEGTYESVYEKVAYANDIDINFCSFRLGLEIFSELALLEILPAKGKLLFRLKQSKEKMDLNHSKTYAKLQSVEAQQL